MGPFESGLIEHYSTITAKFKAPPLAPKDPPKSNLQARVVDLECQLSYINQQLVKVAAENAEMKLVAPISLRRILKVVCAEEKIKMEDLIGQRRTKNVMRPRQIAYYLGKQLTTLSLAQVGRPFGRRDHTTVLHGIKKIERLMQSDLGLAEKLKSYEEKLRGQAQ